MHRDRSSDHFGREVVVSHGINLFIQAGLSCNDEHHHMYSMNKGFAKDAQNTCRSLCSWRSLPELRVQRLLLARTQLAPYPTPNVTTVPIAPYQLHCTCVPTHKQSS